MKVHLRHSTSSFRWPLVSARLMGLASSILALACEPVDSIRLGFERKAISFAQPATAGEFPAVVGLRHEAITSGVTCTGTLIAPQWVLTAAHCFTNVGTADPTKWTVHAGVLDLNSNPSTAHPAAEIHFHPAWDPVNITLGKSDVALIKLANDLPGVTPVELHRSAVPMGTRLTLVGFGRAVAQATTPDQLSGILRKGDNTTISCASMPGQPVISDALSLCFDSSSSPGSCQRDSGGPALLRQDQQWRAVGVSSGSRNATSTSCGQFSIYAAVTSELAFIDKVLGHTPAADAGEPTDAGAPIQAGPVNGNDAGSDQGVDAGAGDAANTSGSGCSATGRALLELAWLTVLWRRRRP